MDIHIDVVVLAADAQCARDFYETLGWRVDPGHDGDDDFRVMRLAPLNQRPPGMQESLPADMTWEARGAVARS